jgi:uncharacterized surface protein with fasciclin (FAS1) repeats
MRIHRKAIAASMVALLALTAAACGDDDDEATADTTEATTDDTAGMDDESAGTIVEVASGSDDFETLVAAVTAADLVETLSGEGPFTVFAPVDAAFEALPAGTVDTLLKPENKEQLTAILTSHVVAGEVMSNDLTDGQKVTTVQGAELTVGIDGGTVTLTDATGATVEVVSADVDASNGVIHAIDGVLMPSK